MTTRSDNTIKVCVEETLDDIKNRYMEFNRNSSSYTWKILNSAGQFITLKSNQTLEQNGIPDESDNYMRLGIDEELYLPNLLMYYNDDLNEA